MYGLHANNMEKVNSWALAKRIKMSIKVYLIVMFLTYLLPSRIYRLEFTNPLKLTEPRKSG